MSFDYLDFDWKLEYAQRMADWNREGYRPEGSIIKEVLGRNLPADEGYLSRKGKKIA